VLTDSNRQQPRLLPAAASGLVAGAAALGVGELVGGFRASWQGPVVSVAEAVIDAVPRPVKDFGIRTFGENDKVALVIGILVFSVIFGAVLGVVARRRLPIAAAGFVAFAAVGVWASQQLVGAGPSAVIPSLAAGAAGVGTLYALIRAIDTRPEQPTERSSSRRQFLALSGTITVVAAVAAAGGRGLRSRFSASKSRADVVLPAAAEPLPVALTTVSTDAPNVSTFYTPNADFYRVDTALAVPQVQAETWSLKITGLVDREIEISYADLLKRTLVEQDITLTCVSNTVGGGLTGTARWLGLPLQELLDEAGVDPSADQIIGHSIDGYTCGFPVEAAYDRPALIAIGMNGEPLPIEHGFPARLMVAGLYGYVSATKWLTEIELGRFADFDQYWVERGWDQQAPIKLMSRIDTPRTLAKVPAGPFVIGGVAWAQTIGISKVEVAIDGDDYVEATLADELNLNTWRQWKIDWDATPGRHRITVRATDANGNLQTDTRADPFPNGASGWMSIFVDVDDA
jgi:DMSO/TMAO reductase YedYZ molybdopterin-dependent catalytic subunit